MKDNGGPAFPGTIIAAEGQWASGPAGMSLRDYFAGQALVGLSIQAGVAASEYIVGESYKIADAMIAERDKA